MAKAKAEEKVRRVSRSKAANRVIAEMGDRATLKELAEAADKLVVASGGKSALADATWHVKGALATAEALGLVKLTRPTDVTVEKVKVKVVK